MSAEKKPSSELGYAVVFAVALAMLLVGLGSFGFWEGAELRTAGLARDAQHVTVSQPPGQVALPHWGMRLLGPREVGARLPGALLALLAAMSLAFATGKLVDARAGMWAGIAYVSLPLVAVNARQIIGGGVAQSCFTLGFSAAVLALWGGLQSPGTGDAPSTTPSPLRSGAWALLAAPLLGVWGAGWMLGTLPIVAGIALALLYRWRDEPKAQRIAGVVLAATAGVVAVLVARSVLRTSDGYNGFVGVLGDARGPALLPTHETLVEHIGHATFPWTGIVAFGAARLLVPTSTTSGSRENALRAAAFLVMVLAFGIQSFHYQLFGPSPFIGVAPLAIAIGLLVRDAEREAVPWRVVTAGATFFTLVMMRDYILFPKSSWAALAIPDSGSSYPTGATEALRGSGVLTGVARFFGSGARSQTYAAVEAALFVLVALAALFQGGGRVDPIAWSRPYTWLTDIEREAKVTYGAAAKAAAGPLDRVSLLGSWTLAYLSRILLAVGAVFVASSGLQLLFVRAMPSMVRTALVVSALLPFLIVFAVYGVVLLWNVLAALGRSGSRIAFVGAGGIAASMVFVHLFFPALSRHMAPRDVWLRASHLRLASEPVARYGTPAEDQAPSFYVPSLDVRLLRSESEAVGWLESSSRQFLVVSSSPDVFPALNRAYRSRHDVPPALRTNVPVLDSQNSNLYLAVSSLGYAPSRNPLDDIVMTHDTMTGPEDHYTLHGRYEGERVVPEPARLDDKIEYLGYNLSLGGAEVVTPGTSFDITYHFHVTGEVTGNHQIFVHIDSGSCPRTNVDHDPAGGRYPVRFWTTGDYVHDTHTITIPPYCRGGRYQVFMGFFQGDNRMHVQGGDHDRDNRIVAANIDVR